MPKIDHEKLNSTSLSINEIRIILKSLMKFNDSIPIKEELNVSVNMMSFFEQISGLKYPYLKIYIPKIDHEKLNSISFSINEIRIILKSLMGFNDSIPIKEELNVSVKMVSFFEQISGLKYPYLKK